MTSPAATILNNYFESPILKATLATDAVIGELSSPYTQNSAYVLLHHVMGEIREKGQWLFVRGGMGSISKYLSKMALERGVEICVEAPVSKVLLN